ncbi:MAG: hypothetical protein R2774_05935 [Saprospiraceae bacterium]
MYPPKHQPHLLKVFMFVILSVFYNKVNACDESSADLVSTVDLGGGQTQYTFDICIEMLGLEGIPDWFSVDFDGAGVNVVSFTPPTVTTSSGDIFTGAIISANDEVRWTFPGVFPAHNSNTMCFTSVIVITGTPTAITVNTHDDYPDADCHIVISLPPPSLQCGCRNHLHHWVRCDECKRK